jgi:SH3 domain-containing YSC84-like protein 1
MNKESGEGSMKVIKQIVFALMVALAMAATPLTYGADDKETTERLGAATDVLNEIMAAPDKGIPQDLLDKSACAVIIPNVKKGAFIVGAKYGRGFIACRKAGGSGWSAPAGIKVEGGSVGLQIGGSETDVIMLLMNQKAINKLLSSKFTIGGDASAAAGPVGRTSSAETDAQLRAEILTYSRTRGLFAGVSLQGATLRPDDDANKDMYGKKMSNQEIVVGSAKEPAAASGLIAALNKYSGKRAR